jgi:hypothetical protein
MVIEGYRKHQSYNEQPNEDRLIMAAQQHQPDETDDQYYKLSSDYIGQNRSDKKTLFAFEERTATVAMMSYVKGPVDDCRLPASGAAQSQRSR